MPMTFTGAQGEILTLPPEIDPRRTKIGELLVSIGLLTRQQLDKALALQKTQKKIFGDLVADFGWVSGENIAKAVALQLDKEYVDLSDYQPSAESIKILSETDARAAMALPLEHTPKGWRVAMADPEKPEAKQKVQARFGPFIGVVAPKAQLSRIFDRIFTQPERIDLLAQAAASAYRSAVGAKEDASAGSDSDIARLIDSIFEEAVAKRASDVHIEPMEDRVNLRFRIDGSLVLINKFDGALGVLLANRLKVLAELEYSEKRKPQDGRFTIQIKGRNIDARIATSPSAYGEAIVIRLLGTSTGFIPLNKLGFVGSDCEDIVEAIRQPNGQIIVTGPTGCGKTTTLYSLLSTLNSVETKIITVEDPIEYRLAGIVQTQVNNAIDFDFATALRSILRQDPDVILVGEMRDRETVDTSLKAAMTGHLVLSTLHTNNAKAAPMRLVDMGAEKYNVADSLRLITAQRLVKLSCPHCAQPEPIPDGVLPWLERVFGSNVPEGKPMRGKGCVHCLGTGWLGRQAIHEVLRFDEKLKELLAHGSAKKFKKEVSKRLHGRSLGARAAALALAGKTTLEEAQRSSGGTY